MNLSAQIAAEGYGVTARLFDDSQVRCLVEALASSKLEHSRAGIRHMMREPAVSAMAHSEEMLSLATGALGGTAVPFRATLFDKSPASNWLVAWHQDTALPLREKHLTDGWGPWSLKDGVIYAHAPRHALEQVIALRLHLDDSHADNGPLRVLPGTHMRGVMTDNEIHALSEKIEPKECLTEAGAVVVMKPLVVHASSKCVSNAPRRILHIEYAANVYLENGLELTVC
jgi:ectoine hydroxylase-related dioxygenase (phytanoyl-CoA dioxygenase family)